MLRHFATGVGYNPYKLPKEL